MRGTFETVVVDGQADFLVCVKDNARDLRRNAELVLQRNARCQRHARTVNKEHGRVEIRELQMVPTTPVQIGWPHVHTVCRVTRTRQVLRKAEVVSSSCEQHCYVASFPTAAYSPEQVLQTVRGHWGIENGLHHRKDRSMNEDRNRASAAGYGRIMCCLRSIASAIVDRTRDSTKVLQRRLAANMKALLGLLSCRSLAEWERRHKPYRLREGVPEPAV